VNIDQRECWMRPFVMQAGLARMLCWHLGGAEHYVAIPVAVQKLTRQAALHHDLWHNVQDHQDADTIIVQDKNLVLGCCSRDFAFSAAVINCILFMHGPWF